MSFDYYENIEKDSPNVTYINFKNNFKKNKQIIELDYFTILPVLFIFNFGTNSSSFGTLGPS